jgi:molybdopterin-guanine dinucleotide biosynthesis protein A
MIQILIPMSGAGDQLEELGAFPKPLFEIGGKPMIEIVTQNLAPAEEHRFFYVCRDEQLKNFALEEVLRLVTDDPAIVEAGQTAGALCTTLLAIDKLDYEKD